MPSPRPVSPERGVRRRWRGAARPVLRRRMLWTAHVVQYSGGAGSWAAAKRVAQRHGTPALWLLFCDTFAERADTYRFLIEGAFNIYGQAAPPELLAEALALPPYLPHDGEHMEERKRLIQKLAAKVRPLLPRLLWEWDGRYPFEVFDDEHFIGSNAAGICSKILKGQVADRVTAARFRPGRTVRYVGIDWTEAHRLDRLRVVAPRWRWEAPMCDEPYVLKEQVLELMEAEGLRRSETYVMGYSHDNCSSLCTKAGHDHWADVAVLEPVPFDSTAVWETRFGAKHGGHTILRDRSKEGRAAYAKAQDPTWEYREWREPVPTPARSTPEPDLFGDPAPAVRYVTRNNLPPVAPFPLPVLRARVQAGTHANSFDVGGCGCFLDDYEPAPTCPTPQTKGAA